MNHGDLVLVESDRSQSVQIKVRESLRGISNSFESGDFADLDGIG